MGVRKSIISVHIEIAEMLRHWSSVTSLTENINIHM